MAIFLKCLRGRLHVDYDEMMRRRGLLRRSAHSTWCRISRVYHLRPGDLTEIRVPRGRDLDALLAVLASVDEAPEVDYDMMTSFANISRLAARRLVTRITNLFLTGLARAAQPAVAQPAVAQPVVAQPVVAQPVVAQPVVAQPVVAQPVVAQPAAAQPAAAPVQATRRSARIAQRAANLSDSDSE